LFLLVCRYFFLGYIGRGGGFLDGRPTAPATGTGKKKARLKSLAL